MKYLVLFSIITMTLLASSYKPQSTANANARQYQGVYIFTDSDPAQEYEVLGTVTSAGMLGGSEYSSVRDRLLKRAKKDYPQVDGIILNLREGKADQADCIKFK